MCTYFDPFYLFNSKLYAIFLFKKAEKLEFCIDRKRDFCQFSLLSSTAVNGMLSEYKAIDNSFFCSVKIDMKSE